MIRFEFGLRKGCLQNFYMDIENTGHKYELRYGVFHGGVAHAEIVTQDDGENDIKELLTKYGMKYELERVL